MALDMRQRLFTTLAALFVTCLLVADLTGSKLWTIDGVSHSVGMLSFPVTFLLTDLMNEYYGPRAARWVTYLGLAMSALTFGLLRLGSAMPVASFSPVSQQAYDAVFGAAQSMFVASLTAYLIGQLIDIWVFHALRRLTRGKLLWLRATGSTVVSQWFDSLVVTFIAFSGQPGPDGAMPNTGALLTMAATGYTLKFVVAVALTPLIYASRSFVHRVFDLEPYDQTPASGNPGGAA
jgi:uncharacterized integral membrane protein (TIGR00697 family)